MQQLTTTPFGQRPVTAALMARLTAQRAAPASPHIDKWQVFRALCCARKRYDVSDRDLAVLNALLSFHPDANLSDNGNLVVFPSNAALSERAHGMAESTLRRHLAALVRAGLIARHDSPNGKRYARRGPDGAIARAFGFDLRPLLVQAEEIQQQAEAEKAARAEHALAREAVTLLKRDALKLALYGQDQGLPGDWSAVLDRLMQVHKASRRKLDLVQLSALKSALEQILRDIQAMLTVDNPAETEKASGNDSENERHLQNSQPDSYESEPSCEENHAAKPNRPNRPQDMSEKDPSIPLALVLKACPDILPYCDRVPQNWRELIGAAAFVRSMMGISASAWDEAQRHIGPGGAAITVACILQRFSHIRCAGGYLRNLSGRAAEGAFSPGPMVMALLNTNRA
ncbi:plasmid replication protein RepC [Microbulbifer sp. S227A]|uniref:plasmid replication protein RepC n=1 Tax=Microbulbifer sp. S227A TaxID=3415131 RepID=UPI003C79F1D9